MPIKQTEKFAHFRAPGFQIQLAGEDQATPPPTLIQVLRAGKYNHPAYGEFEIKASDILKMKDNFDKKVRGVDLALDFAHESQFEAAAWITALHVKAEGAELWAEVTWTPKGKQSILDREFRYVSADFNFDYQNNETLETFGPTLNGAALTNRPVIKEMSPVIELSEGAYKQDTKPKGKDENLMDPKDKMIEELKAKIAELEAKLKGNDTELGSMKAKLSEYEANDKKAKDEKELAEKKTEFDKMLSEGKVVEAQREPFMKNDMKAFTSAAQPLKLSDVGHGGEGVKPPQGDEKKTAQDQVIEKANVLLSEKKAGSMTEAIRNVLLSDSKLKSEYEKEVAV